MLVHNEACSCSSAKAQVWAMTFLTSLPRPTGCRGIPSLRQPFQIAMSMETKWAAAWTRRSAVVLFRCRPTFSLGSIHSCGGGNSTVASSTTHALTCSSRTTYALLACYPPLPLVCRHHHQQDHLPIVVAFGPNAAAMDGVELLVVSLGLLAKSSTLTTFSAFLALRIRHQRQRRQRRH